MVGLLCVLLAVPQQTDLRLKPARQPTHITPLAFFAEPAEPMSFRFHPFFHELRHLAREHWVILLLALFFPLLGAADYLLYWQDAAQTGGTNFGLGIIAETSPWYVLIAGFAAYRMFSLFRKDHHDAAWRTTPVSFKTLFLARVTALALLFVGWPMLIVGAVAQYTWPDSLADQVLAVAVWLTFGLSGGAYVSVFKNGWWRLVGVLVALRAVHLLMLSWGRGIYFSAWNLEFPQVSPLWHWMLIAGTVALPIAATLHLKLKSARVRFLSELTVLCGSFIIVATFPIKLNRLEEAQVILRKTDKTERFEGTATNTDLEYWSNSKEINRAVITMQLTGVNDRPDGIIERMHITRVSKVGNLPERNEQPIPGAEKAIHIYKSNDCRIESPLQIYINLNELKKLGPLTGLRELRICGLLTQSIHQPNPILKTDKFGPDFIKLNNRPYPVYVERHPERKYSTKSKTSGTYVDWILPPQWTVRLNATQVLPWFGITIADDRLLGFDLARVNIIEKKSQTRQNYIDSRYRYRRRLTLINEPVPIPTVCELNTDHKREPMEISVELFRLKSIVASPFELTLKLPENFEKIISAKTNP